MALLEFLWMSGENEHPRLGAIRQNDILVQYSTEGILAFRPDLVDPD